MEADRPTLETCISVALDEARYDEGEGRQLSAELAGLRAIADTAWALVRVPSIPVYPDRPPPPNHPAMTALIDALFAYRLSRLERGGEGRDRRG